MARTDRRRFLKQSLAALAGSAAFDSVFGKIALAATTAPAPRRLEGTGYRALVCLYLYGGNDCFNMVVPRDGYWSTYSATRGSLAIPQADLLPLNPSVPPGRRRRLRTAPEPCRHP